MYRSFGRYEIRRKQSNQNVGQIEIISAMCSYEDKFGKIVCTILKNLFVMNTSNKKLMRCTYWCKKTIIYI